MTEIEQRLDQLVGEVFDDPWAFLLVCERLRLRADDEQTGRSLAERDVVIALRGVARRLAAQGPQEGTA